MKKDNCKTCRFFMPDVDGKKLEDGWCQRFPPQAITLGGSDYSNYAFSFPGIIASEWCGEFQRKKKAAPSK